MNEMLVYGISSLLICFTVLTFLLSRLPTDIFPEEYELKLDPFWYVTGVMFIGATIVYFLFPTLPDMIRSYSYFSIFIPFLFAVIIYGCYLLELGWITDVITFGAALIISFTQADDFQLFPNQLTVFQDRIVVAVLLFVISKGLNLLNGQAAIASMQFCAVMISGVVLAYFNALPQFLSVIALVYLGSMISFAFFSWPPEKIIMGQGSFGALGFIMGCFMLNASSEFADAPMFIAGSYLFTELAIALYNRFICREKTAELFMNTSYYKTSQDGQYDLGVARGVLKILVIDVVLSMIQIAASERLALPVFTVALNMWFLSILSGDSKPGDIISLSKFGKMAYNGLFKKKSKKKK